MSDYQPLSVLQLDAESEVAANLRLPAMSPSELIAKALTVAQLKGAGVTVSPSSAPTVDHDAGEGYWPRWLWVRESPATVWICLSTADGAAVWRDLTTASVTGLGNPLTEALNGNNELIHSALFAGLRDHYYDLADDPSSLVDAGVATLNQVYNAWSYGGLDDALEIELPDPNPTGGGALFGVISVELAEGGSVTLADEPAWLWERGHPSDPDPEIPAAAGSRFRLRYSWDPIGEAYAVSVSHLTPAAPASLGEVLLVAGGVQATHKSSNTGDTHSHTHNWVSTTQDGGVYLLLLLAADGTAAPSADPGSTTQVTDPPNGSGTEVQGRWRLYKPSQGDLDGDSTAFSWTKSNEQSTIVSVEVQGPPAGIEIGQLEYNRASASNRTALSGPTVTAPAGALVISSVTKDRTGSNGTEASVAVASAAGFENIYSLNTTASDRPVVNINALEVAEAGSLATPDYSTNATTVAGASQLEVFVLEPAAP